MHYMYVPAGFTTVGQRELDSVDGWDPADDAVFLQESIKLLVVSGQLSHI